MLTDNLPSSVLGRVNLLEELLTAHATDGRCSPEIYVALRKEFIANPNLKALLPPFVRSCRDISAFWACMRKTASTYAERRTIIREAFTPLSDYLENTDSAPGDMNMSSTLQSFDAQGVHQIWSKALERRNTDPDGAITVARTLLETVCKRILDETGNSYTDKEDLPELYGLAAHALNLAPDQHSEKPIKAILGGAMNLVNGLGTLRNRLSDAHGRGGRIPAKPSPRHASLAVNMAGAMATFLVETYAASRS